jgi:hypothetical protein
MDAVPRQIKRLSAIKIATNSRPGMYADGNGLYLQVTTTGSKSWIYRYKSGGRAHDMGLGSARLVGPSEARALAAEADRVRHNGRDPIVERKAARAAARRGNGGVLTFNDAAAAYIAAHEAAWKNPKHRAQWRSTLAT